MGLEHRISLLRFKGSFISDKKYAIILNSLPGMVAYLDADLRYCFVNDAYKKMIGKDDDEIIGHSVSEVLGEVNYQQIKNCISNVLQGNIIYFEQEMTFSNRKCFIEVTLTPDYDRYRNVNGYIVFANDITEKKKLEKQLEQKNKELMDYFANATIGLHWVDAKGIIKWANLVELNMLGYSEEEYIGHHISEFYADRKTIDDTLSSLSANKELNNFEAVLRCKDGSFRNVMINSNVDRTRLNLFPHPQSILDLSGEVTGAINMLVDITERKKAEEANAKLAAIVQSSDDAIISKTLDGVVVSWNNAAERIFGYSSNEMIGESITKIIPLERIDEEPQILQRLKKGERIDHFETERVAKDGKILNVSLTISPVKNSKGDIIGISKIARDITEQKKLYKALRDSGERFRRDLEKQVEEKTQDLKLANLRLEKSNQELERFTYVASHDLQEPLRKIQAFGDLIAERNGKELNDSGKDYLSRMIKAAHRMQKLIEALLQFSRSTTTKKDFEKRDLNLLIDEIKNDLHETIAEKQAIVIVSPLPTIQVIPFQFKQMVSNIISNSLKYTKPNEAPVININSEIVTEIHFDKNSAKNNIDYCKITIRDYGIGFDNEDAERIFELFQRLHGMQEYRGSGIGLSICKKIAENHGGFIVAEGERNKGAAFHIYVPMRQNEILS